MYSDAYTLQAVEVAQLRNVNYIAGMVPFLLNLTLDVCYTTAQNYILIHLQ